MTSFTPVYGLPYPDALNAPCDFPEDWCTFAAAVDAVLDRFELGAQRVLPAIPIAKVLVTEQVVLSSGEAFPFDAVSVDTAGWTNFDEDNRVITVSRGGRYSLLTAAIVATGGVLNGTYSLDTSLGNNNDVEALDRNAQDIGMTTQSEVQDIAAGTAISLFAFTPGANVTLRSASLTVFWHADEERP